MVWLLAVAVSLHALHSTADTKTGFENLNETSVPLCMPTVVQTSNDTNSGQIIIFAAISILIVLIAVTLLLLFRRNASRRTIGFKDELPMFETEGTGLHTGFTRFTDDQQLCNLKFRGLFVPSQDVALTSLLSTGDGRWRDALWSSHGSTISAVFAPQPDSSALERNSKRLLLLEHPHVIKLLGLVGESPGPGLLLETAAKMDLKTFLRRHKPDPLKPQTDDAFEDNELLTAIVQMTSALSYLESKGIAHGRVRSRFEVYKLHQLMLFRCFFVDSERNIKLGLESMSPSGDDFRWLDTPGIQQHLNRQTLAPSTHADIFAFATVLFEVVLFSTTLFDLFRFSHMARFHGVI